MDNGIDWGDVSKIKRTLKNQSYMHYEINVEDNGAEKNGALPTRETVTPLILCAHKSKKTPAFRHF